MSSQNPLDSNIPPERPKDPTHFGGEGLYGPQADASATADDDTLKVPLSEHLGSAEQGLAHGNRRPDDSAWAFAKRNHVPALLAIGGIAWLLAALIRRATRQEKY
jgi:hypothetical protein